jgi:hypothetical protein
MMRQIRLVSLLDPQSDWLSNQRFEFYRAGSGNEIDGEFAMAANPRVTDNSLRQQNIIAEWAIQFQKAITLDESASYCPDYVLCSHTASSC